MTNILKKVPKILFYIELTEIVKNKEVPAEAAEVKRFLKLW